MCCAYDYCLSGHVHHFNGQCSISLLSYCQKREAVGWEVNPSIMFHLRTLLASKRHTLSPVHQQSISFTSKVRPVNEPRIPAKKPSSNVQTDSSTAGKPDQSRSSPPVTVKSMFSMLAFSMRRIPMFRSFNIFWSFVTSSPKSFGCPIRFSRSEERRV